MLEVDPVPLPPELGLGLLFPPPEPCSLGTPLADSLSFYHSIAAEQMPGE